MPRYYVKKVDARTYSRYTSETLQAAVDTVQINGSSIYSVSRSFSIPYGTLYNKVHGLHMQKPGPICVLTEKQEEDLAEVVRVTGIWGYPLTPACIMKLVKQFVTCSKTTTKFHDNSPGPDWVNSFLKRHNLVARLSQNIKRSRAKVSHEVINEFFINLAETVDGIPPENIVNYDETNFSDDPGSKRVVVQRGQKHVDRVMDHSKSSFSVMFAGAANGKMLPPYVVYAALHLYPTWTDGGPKGCRYNRTKSGWFDSVVFEDWFFKTAVPYFNALDNDQKRIIIGDNVASHLSYRVLQFCMTNNINFVFLPPNATHLCQPLDVAYFRPLKRAWSDTLGDWKKRNKGCVPKHIFPRLLKKALLTIEAKSSQNMRAGFKASGIYPLNKDAVLKKLPNDVDNEDTAANTSFSEQLIIMLKEERFGKIEERTIPRKRRLIEIQPGSSVTEEQAQQLMAKKVKIQESSDAADKSNGSSSHTSNSAVTIKEKLTKKSTSAAQKSRHPLKDRSNKKEDGDQPSNYNPEVVIKQELACEAPKVAKRKRKLDRGKLSGLKKLRL